MRYFDRLTKASWRYAEITATCANSVSAVLKKSLDFRRDVLSSLLIKQAVKS